MIELQTARMSATPLSREHFADLRRLHTDPRVTATLSIDGNPFSEFETRGLLERSEEHWRRYGFGLWALRMKASNEFAGYAGIKHATVENRDEIELAYAISAELWGKGLAPEMSGAALKHGFETLGLKKIVAMTLPHNRASRSVMEKCGFTFSREILHAGLPHVLYILDSPAPAA